MASHRRITTRRPSVFAASVGAATVALAAASAGTVAMWPASATSQSARSGPAQAGNSADELPPSAGDVMQIRAVYQASAVRAARAKARRQAAERARLAAKRAAAERAAEQAAQQKAQAAQPAQPAAAAAEPSGSPKQIAQSMLASFGWGQDQWGCLDQLWEHESGWSVTASNPSGAYGIPQALPGSKMASAGPNWETNASTQIKWGLGYIQSKYGSPCGAWSNEESSGYY